VLAAADHLVTCPAAVSRHSGGCGGAADPGCDADTIPGRGASAGLAVTVFVITDTAAGQLGQQTTSLTLNASSRSSPGPRRHAWTLCRVAILCRGRLRLPQSRRVKVGNEDLLQHVPILRMLGDADLPGIGKAL
jgi:hypothetical protein